MTEEKLEKANSISYEIRRCSRWAQYWEGLSVKDPDSRDVPIDGDNYLNAPQFLLFEIKTKCIQFFNDRIAVLTKEFEAL